MTTAEVAALDDGKREHRLLALIALADEPPHRWRRTDSAYLGPCDDCGALRLDAVHQPEPSAATLRFYAPAT